MRTGGKLLLAALCVAAIAAALLASPSMAATTVCAPGSGAGQCSNPGGVAADFETDRVYVADRANNRIDVFEVEGASVTFKFAFGWGVDTGAEAFEICTTESGCQAGKAGSGVGQFNDPRRIAVDNDLGGLGSEGHHDIYVYDGGSNRRVQKFEPSGEQVGEVGPFGEAIDLIAVGPEGLLYVGDVINFDEKTQLKRYNPKLEASGECELREDRLNGGLAVDSSGDAYAKFNLGGGIFKFEWAEPTCLEVETPPFPLEPSVETTALAFDAADGLLAGQGVPGLKVGSYRVATHYTPAGAPARRYGYGELAGPIPGIAPLATEAGDALAAEQGGSVKYLSEPPAGPVIASTSAKAGNVSATLEAEVNPEGKASDYLFEYLSEAEWEENGGSFEAGPNPPKEAEGEIAVEDFELHLASASVGCEDAEAEAAQCLVPETPYRFRVSAGNADGEGNSPLEGSFTTKEPLEIEEVFVSEVGPDSARLSAAVNPLGIPASGYFEYEPLGSGEATRVPAAGAIDFGAGEAGITKSAAVGGLSPGTTYRLRFKATDSLLGGEEITAEDEPLFRTPPLEVPDPCPQNRAFRAGAGAFLPDCRAYELVTPLDKAGGDVVNLVEGLYNLPTVLNQSSLSGDKVAYGSYRAFGDADAAPYTAQYIAARDDEEWISHYILGPRAELTTRLIESLESELKALSPDLCEAWLKTLAEPRLAPAAVTGEPNLYRRTDGECGAESYEALTTAAPLTGNLEKIELQGAAADGSAAVFVTWAQLAGEAPAKGSEFSLYYQDEGEGAPEYVCRGTDGLPIAASCSAGGPLTDPTARGRSASLYNAFSEDGERVFFSTPTTKGSSKIYMRANPGEPESARLHGAAAGTGTVLGPGVGKGRVLTSNPTKVTNFEALAGGFAPGQELSDSAGKIPAGTTIVSCSPNPDCSAPSELTLSQSVTGNSFSDEIAGHPSATVLDLTAKGGAFKAGQRIEGPGIPPGATIVSCAPECGEAASSVTLSEVASATGVGVSLSATSPCTEAATRACTIAVSAVAEGIEGSTSSQYWWAAADGSRAIFETGGTLYEFEVESETTTEIAKGAVGVMGASEDARRVYLASTLDLGSGPNPLGDEAQPGKPNLYLAEGGELRFVATLVAESDTAALSKYASITPQPQARTARVSPDGMHAAFTTTGQPTGYDSTDARSGEADMEVFLYDAAGEGKLVCASCNPSGGRPVGEELPLKAVKIWAAASLPVWFKALYPGRVLSEDGSRLYFEAADALVARDSNGATDVYQWEEAGTGGCEVQDPEYSAQNGGCVSLVSSGQSSGEARFVDASPSGDDVFFTTAASLVGWDYGLIDVYDARVDGGLPAPPATPQECEGESCQSPPPAPEAAPGASLQYEGPGNVREAASPLARCDRTARRAKRLSTRAKALRRAARGSKAPAAKRRRMRGARRSAGSARKLSRNAKRCRVRARAAARRSR
jgi:hypothetical protein